MASQRRHNADERLGAEQADAGVGLAQGVAAFDVGAHQAVLHAPALAVAVGRGAVGIAAQPGDKAHFVDGRHDEHIVGPLAAVEIHEGAAQRGKAPGKQGVQRRQVVGVAEVAQVPHLLDAVALAGVQHGLHRAEIVLVGRFFNLAQRMPSRTVRNLKGCRAA